MNNFTRPYLMMFIFAYSALAFAQSTVDKKALEAMTEIQTEFNLPSFSMAISMNNEVVFAEAVGLADIKTLKPADSHTQYSVGSIAKPMTGLALLKLVDDKKIVLDAPVSSYLAHPKYSADIKVVELAAHTAGIPHNTPEREIAEFKNTKDHDSPFDAFYTFEKYPLDFVPGSQYKYSSHGYILLSALIEKVANESYVDFLRASLWEEFEMTSTELDTSFAGRKNEATYYEEYSDKDTYTESTKRRDRSFLFGGGGFISTPTDLVKMAQATFAPNYLSHSTRRVLFEPVKLSNGEVNSENYSIGWRVGQLTLNENDQQYWKALHHGGVTDNAATSYLFVIPDCRAAIAFATNHIPDKFWRIRGRVARLLTKLVDRNHCRAN